MSATDIAGLVALGAVSVGFVKKKTWLVVTGGLILVVTYLTTGILP